MFNRPLVLTMCCVVAAIAPGALAVSTFSYGDFNDLLNGGNVTYANVAESSSTGVALYGQPQVQLDSIYFNPTDFGAFADKGASKQVQGVMTTTLQAAPGQVLSSLSVKELGDLSLFGTGTDATKVSVAGALGFTVTRIDGRPVSPITWNDALQFGLFPIRQARPSGEFTLPTDGGAGQLWEGSGFVDFDAKLASMGYSGHATEVSISLDNDLLAVSESGSAAFIEKKIIGGTTITVQTEAIVPEPLTFMGMGMGLVVVGRRLLGRD